MRYTVQYIPLCKIRPDPPAGPAQAIKNWRRLLWDGMHLLAVRKSRKGGGYVLISGHERFEFLRRHTKKTHAPCIVEEHHPARMLQHIMPSSWNSSIWGNPASVSDRLTPASWRIIRTFLRQEPRFSRLSPNQRIKVLWLGIRYRQTVVHAMKAAVRDMLLPKEPK